jgi:hypothetical protein
MKTKAGSHQNKSTHNDVKKQKFHMHGHLIEFDVAGGQWTWHKWEYVNGWEDEQRVVRRSGGIEFMKMMPSLFNNSKQQPAIQSKEQMETVLKKSGVDFIFLYQGQTTDEKQFKTVEEAEKYHGLESYRDWDLTEYWFSYDSGIQSWAMFDSFSGQLEFTPQSAVKRLNKSRPVGTRFMSGNRHPGMAAGSNESPTYH